MSYESRQLLPLRSTLGSFTGSKSQAAGYHKQSDNLHTIIANFNNWSGELKIQGTLKLYPNDTTDWFDLKDLSNTTIVIGDSSTDYDNPVTVSTRGNFVYIRAVGTITAGEITEIRYTY